MAEDKVIMKNKGNTDKTTRNEVVFVDQLRCMYTNVRSFMNKNKRDEMELLLLEKKY
jgi:hypothetical protein